MAGKHSLFAPSSASRVMACPGSLRLNMQEPDTTSFEAVEGTVAHYIHEQCLLMNCSAERFRGMHPVQFMPVTELTAEEWRLLPYSRGVRPDDDFIVDGPMVGHIDESVLRCRERPGDAYVEKRVDISPWCPVPDQGGTADFFVCSPGVLDITDLKYGIGVMVFAYMNYQAILYALGVINEYDWLYDFDKVYIRIHQPRLDHYDVWETTKAELLQIGELIKERFAIAWGENAPLQAGAEQCKFCKRAYKCEEIEATVMKHFESMDEFSDAAQMKEDARSLSVERQVEVFKALPLIKAFIGALENHITLALLHDRDSVPGLRLVNSKRTRRRWTNEEQAAEELLFNDVPEDKIYEPRRLISPAQAEKINRKVLKPIISEMVMKTLGKPVVVDASDPRPDYEGDNTAAALRHFDVEDDD